MERRRQLYKKNNIVFKPSNLCYLLIFLMFNILHSHGSQDVGIERQPRYAEFDPPRILPANDFQTVTANSRYTVTCEGSRGVSWRIPEIASKDLRSRISISHDEPEQTRKNKLRQHSRRAFRNNNQRDTNNPKTVTKQGQIGEKSYVTVLTITGLKYSDTGTFTCTYNGTTDLDSIDNSTSVHLYVDDRNHLLRTSGFDFLQAVQSQTLVLPCMPTHPDVNVTLWREGSGGQKRVFISQYISFDPKVGSFVSYYLS